MLADPRKRIVLIEDHVLFRQGLERLLNTGDEFVVIEEAGEADEGLEVIRELRPDAVIVDIGLPGERNGIDLTESLRCEFPNLVVIILSAHDEPEYRERALAAGAVAYLRKDEAIDTLRAVLREALSQRVTRDVSS